MADDESLAWIGIINASDIIRSDKLVVGECDRLDWCTEGYAGNVKFRIAQRLDRRNRLKTNVEIYW